MSAPNRDETLPELISARMDQLDIRSARGLAAATGIAPDTARLLLQGKRRPDDRTLRKLADALRLPLPRVRRAADRPSGELTTFVLPPEADGLDQTQRELVVAMVRALLRSTGDNPLGVTPDTQARTLRAVPRLVGRQRDPFSPFEPEPPRDE